MHYLFSLSLTVFLLIFTNISLADENTAKFIGSKTCKDCHSRQFSDWQGSHHDLAMQHASKAAVLGDFNNSKFSANGITTTFFKKDEKFWVNTDAADGSLQNFEIKYTFGFTPLQQYLIEFSDGRIQALGIAWDSRPLEAGGQRWFHLYPEQKVDSRHSLHWTGQQQNWNYMCADCHSTNLEKGYDSNHNTFKTTWSEINVACEACHGPGEQHLAWSTKDKNLQVNDVNKGLKYLLHDRKNVMWTMDVETGTAKRNKTANNNQEIEVCAACHSRRGFIKPGIESDASFLDHYRPALLSNELYHLDGQIKDEVFVWGSFMQSKMQAAGVTCSDCHDPHTQKLRSAQEQVCTQCHLPTKYNTRQHHKHAEDSAGANCLDCHMPETTYMVVDPRRDHSIRIPRPDLALKTLAPDACTQCHQAKSTKWAAEKFTQYWPDIGKPFQNWSTSISLARSGKPQAEIALIKVIRDQQTPDIARATAVSELPPYLSPLSGKVLEGALLDKSPLVRLAALGALEALPAENRYQFAAPLLQDPILAVRSEAARIAAPGVRSQLEPQERQILMAAISEYIDTQHANAERPESHLNLGNLYSNSGDLMAAEAAYSQALKLDPEFGPAYANLADLYRAQGQEAQAKKILTDGLSKLPENTSLHHALGLMQVRGRQLDLALISLKKAATLEPENARYTYVYGVALNSTGQADTALQILEQSLNIHPRNQEIIFMLASINRDQGKNAEALKWAQRLLEINPADKNAIQFIQQINSTSQ